MKYARLTETEEMTSASDMWKKFVKKLTTPKYSLNSGYVAAHNQKSAMVVPKKVSAK